MPKRKNPVLRKPKGRVRAMVYIGGSGPFNQAVVCVRLMDCNIQDAPAKLLAGTCIDVESRPAHDWVVVDFDFDWPTNNSHFDLSKISVQAEIRRDEDGKLIYTTQVAHPTLDLTTGLEWKPVVVVQKV
jgi:uncharacterized lipoprotein YbaY